ncbi:MAG: type 4a pilus biogenesis protein PilO [Parcubacteria group bacterium]|nr:type 4a pilus biogenesis protein PilO [Parcubacteria group bacterium]
MKASTKRLVSIFAGIALIGAAAFVFFNVAFPTWQRVGNLRSEVGEKEAVRDQLSGLVAKAQELLSRFDNLNQEAQPISRALPSDPRLPEVLAIINTLALQNKLSLTQVNFEEVLSRLGAANRESRPRPAPLKVLVTLSGQYTDLKNWLKAVENELRLMDVEEISIQPISVAGGQGQLNFAVTLTVYYQPKPELIGPSASSGQAPSPQP